MNNLVDLDWYRFKREIEEVNAMLDDLDQQYASMIRLLARWGPITEEMRQCLERN